MSNKIEIEIGNWPTISGSQDPRIVVRPAAERESGIPLVYSFGHVGPGCPFDIWHKRSLDVGTVTTITVPESLQEWLEANQDELISIAEEYQGSEWDGHNHIGRWTQDGIDMSMAFEQKLEAAINNGEIDQYWDASDWFAVDSVGCAERACEHNSIDEAVQSEINDADHQGSILKFDDVKENIIHYLKLFIESNPEEAEKAHQLLKDIE